MVFLGLAVAWYERYIRRLKKQDPTQAADELRPTGELMREALKQGHDVSEVLGKEHTN